MLRWQLSNKVLPLNLRLKVQMTCTWIWTTLACMGSPWKPKRTERTSTWTQRVQSIWRCPRCFARLAWSWNVEMWATRAYISRIVYTWRVCSTSARMSKKPVFCSRGGHRTPPGSWVSPQSVGTMPVRTLEQRHSREIPWSSSSVDLTWTFSTKRPLFLKKSITTWSWCRFKTTLCASQQRQVKVLCKKITK